MAAAAPMTLFLLMALLTTNAHLHRAVEVDGGGVTAVSGGRKMGLVVNKEETALTVASSSSSSSPAKLSCKIGDDASEEGGDLDDAKEAGGYGGDYRPPRTHPPQIN